MGYFDYGNDKEWIEDFETFENDLKTKNNVVDLGYCRISSPSGKVDRQTRKLNLIYNIVEENMYSDFNSGVSKNRKQLNIMIERIKNNPQTLFNVYVSRVSRLSRGGFEECLCIINEIVDCGGIIYFVNDNFNSSDLDKKEYLMRLETISNEAKSYSDNRSLDIKEGIKLSQEKKRIEGLTKRGKKKDFEYVKKCIELNKLDCYTLQEIGDMCYMTRQSVSKYIKKYNNGELEDLFNEIN